MIYVLVTSSRTWQNKTLVYRALDAAKQVSVDGKVKVTHGDCPTGGDHHAKLWAEQTDGAINDPHPADWKTLGKKAGFTRNEDMVDQVVKLHPRICLAFINPCVKPDCPDGPDEHDSHGAAHTVGLCEFEKIDIEIFREKVGGEYWPSTDGPKIQGLSADAPDYLVKARTAEAEMKQRIIEARAKFDSRS
jgi:hypothetical protein